MAVRECDQVGNPLMSGWLWQRPQFRGRIAKQKRRIKDHRDHFRLLDSLCFSSAEAPPKRYPVSLRRWIREVIGMESSVELHIRHCEIHPLPSVREVVIKVVGVHHCAEPQNLNVGQGDRPARPLVLRKDWEQYRPQDCQHPKIGNDLPESNPNTGPASGIAFQIEPESPHRSEAATTRTET